MEIVLQRARCYRNFRDPGSLQKAEEILSELEKQVSGRYFRARLYRERALVREMRGDRQGAKELFNAGINVDTAVPYIENHIGLANLLIKEAEELPPDEPHRLALNRRAVALFETARRHEHPLFDRLYIGAYIEALIEIGEYERAFPLLEDALKSRPNDERLNYRMAELLRKRELLDEAEPYALRSVRKDRRRSILSLVNIWFSQAQRISGGGISTAGTTKLKKALDLLAQFRPEYGHDQEIADSIASKIHRSLGELDKAKALMAKYQHSSNSYTVYEQCRVDLQVARVEWSAGRKRQAEEHAQKVVDRIGNSATRRPLNEELERVLLESRMLLKQWTGREPGNEGARE